jgi:hypothetical protein
MVPHLQLSPELGQHFQRNRRQPFLSGLHGTLQLKFHLENNPKEEGQIQEKQRIHQLPHVSLHRMLQEYLHHFNQANKLYNLQL